MSPFEHEPFVRRGVELAQQAPDAGDVTNRTEVEAIRSAQRHLNTTDLSACSIHSNCEPCPMGSFMIRELKFKEIVFARTSPNMGGYSRWNILQDDGLVKYAPAFTTPPTVTTGVLEQEAADQFDRAGRTIHGR